MTKATAAKIVKMMDRYDSLTAVSNEAWSRVFAGDGSVQQAQTLTAKADRLMTKIGRYADA